VVGGALALAPVTGCSEARYVWIDRVPDQPAGDGFVIAPGDLVSVRVFNQENMSTRARVRSDGKISVPFLGDVELRGKAPGEASRELAARFKDFVVSPVVTITVEETRPTAVSVLGEVTKPGIYTLDAPAGVLQALAAAGGLTEYASRDSIYVVRSAPSSRVRFTFSGLAQGDARAAAFRLRAGDVVIVE
jgi:polysaccharide export outer membrane protein